MKFKSVQFEGRDQREFFKAFRSRVEDYFKSNNISRIANTSMIIKTISMLIMYFLPFALLVSGIISSYGVLLLLWAAMGWG